MVTWQVASQVSSKTKQAIRKGDLVRQPCEVCQSTHNVHAHHEDYSKPLDVMWLCATHHRARHEIVGQLVQGQPDSRTVVYIDPALLESLKIIAKKRKWSMSATINNLLGDYFKTAR